jgi:hypothetical protein
VAPGVEASRRSLPDAGIRLRVRTPMRIGSRFFADEAELIRRPA